MKLQIATRIALYAVLDLAGGSGEQISSGEIAERCRELSGAELAGKPAHMRNPVECARERAPVRMRIIVDGEPRVDRTYAPSGLFHDGASIANKGGFAGATLVLEAAEGFMFSASLEGPVVEATSERGAHGYPPERVELRASLIMSGAHIKRGHKLGVVDMTDVAPTVAKLLSLSLPGAEGHALDDALVP